ncbi:MAG TPA: hypothetical protein VIN59_01425, partial [Alphaproteobacteria bacterium]
SKVARADTGDGWSIEEYTDMLLAAGADAFDRIIVPLYLTKQTTPQMIEKGVKSGLLKAAKYYPPHGTTGADFGMPIDHYMDNGVLQAMADNGVILCVHGEEHGLPPETYFARDKNAEEIFYQERMPKLIERFPGLKIVAEHVTTKVAVDFVTSAPATIAASVTPQHLLYTVGHLIQGLKYHLYCLPVLKFDTDRDAIRTAVMNSSNAKFFAGTDSAPHTQKVTPCGCAAGCYTGGIAPQLYAQSFESAGKNFQNTDVQGVFKAFLCTIGPKFYGFTPISDEFTLKKGIEEVKTLQNTAGTIVPLPVGLSLDPAVLTWSVE